jgi:hypothetical protein
VGVPLTEGLGVTAYESATLKKDMLCMAKDAVMYVSVFVSFSLELRLVNLGFVQTSIAWPWKVGNRHWQSIWPSKPLIEEEQVSYAGYTVGWREMSVAFRWQLYHEPCAWVVVASHRDA